MSLAGPYSRFDCLRTRAVFLVLGILGPKSYIKLKNEARTNIGITHG